MTALGEVFEWLRVINALMALAAVTLVTNMATTHWSEYDLRARWLTGALGVLLVDTVYGSVEQALRGDPGSPRTLFVTIAAIMVFRAWAANGLIKDEDD